MDVGAESLARAIGARVKRQRRALRWTLDQLAAAAQVSRRMVINVEQGSVNPSVGTLLRLSEALGVGLPALVEPPTSDPVRLIRKGTGAVLWTGEHGGQGMLVAGTGTGSPEVVEMWDWSLMPGERHVSQAHTEGARELLLVRDGVVVVHVDGQDHALEAGDALTFPGDVAHSYMNPNDQPARFCLTVHEPKLQAAHRTESADA